MFILRNPHKMPNTNDRQRCRCRLQTQDVNAENCSSITYKTHKRCRLAGMSCAVVAAAAAHSSFHRFIYNKPTHCSAISQPGLTCRARNAIRGASTAETDCSVHSARTTIGPSTRLKRQDSRRVALCQASVPVSAFFVKEYFPVPSSGGNQCKNRHAPIWHFG